MVLKGVQDVLGQLTAHLPGVDEAIDRHVHQRRMQRLHFGVGLQPE